MSLTTSASTFGRSNQVYIHGWRGWSAVFRRSTMGSSLSAFLADENFYDFIFPHRRTFVYFWGGFDLLPLVISRSSSSYIPFVVL